jgi:hypothetical protein
MELLKSAIRQLPPVRTADDLHRDRAACVILERAHTAVKQEYLRLEETQ